MSICAKTDRVKVTISDTGVVTITSKSKRVVVTINDDGTVTTKTEDPP